LLFRRRFRFTGGGSRVVAPRGGTSLLALSASLWSIGGCLELVALAMATDVVGAVG
jgi:hypothetical protein